MNHVVSRLLAAALAVPALAAAGQPAPASKAPAAAAPAVAQPFKDVGLWYGVFGTTICSWFDSGDGVFLVDTGSTAADAKALKAEIAKTTKNKPVKWIAMTHLHTDSNEGLAAFFPADVTIFVNARSTAVLADFVGRQKSPAPNVVGVGERLVLVAGKLRLEIGVPPANAHTGSDLYVFDAVTRTAFVGDLVTPDRCPMLSDPDSDIKGWIVGARPARRAEARRPRRVAREPDPGSRARNRADAPVPHEPAPVPHGQEKAERARGARLGRAGRREDRRLLPARAEHAQRAERLPADRGGRVDRAGLDPGAEDRSEVTPAPPEPCGARASTVVWMPPRGVNTPRTAIRRGWSAATRSSRTRFTTFSLKIPSERYAFTYSLSDFSSTQSRSGTYVIVSVAKSGSPVFGQIDVNSGIVITTS